MKQKRRNMVFLMTEKHFTKISNAMKTTLKTLEIYQRKKAQTEIKNIGIIMNILSA